MKLSLNQLRVDSYAAQLNEKEITEIKGGSSTACETVLYIQFIIAPIIGALALTGIEAPDRRSEVDSMPPEPDRPIIET